MIELKDIAGLSKPLTKLVEVIAEGVGGISRPFLTRKNAEAKAYEIDTLTQAIAKSQNLLGPIKYEEGSITIESIANLPSLPNPNVDQRVFARIAYREAKKQSNLERITQYAADELKDESEVSDEQVDSDWISRFFTIAEDITTDEMQMLWGRILAGEVKKPRSYSLRTLDLLKNITREEAEVFVKVAKFAITRSDEDKPFLIYPNNGRYLEKKCGIRFVEILLLREIGLLSPSGVGLEFQDIEENVQILFVCGETCISVERLKGTPPQTISTIVFSEIGKQLLNLVEKAPAELQYVQRFASLLRREGVAVQFGEVTEWSENGIKCDSLQEVP